MYIAHGEGWVGDILTECRLADFAKCTKIKKLFLITNYRNISSCQKKVVPMFNSNYLREIHAHPAVILSMWEARTQSHLSPGSPDADGE